jgi:hypothetical protein
VLMIPTWQEDWAKLIDQEVGWLFPKKRPPEEE